MTTEQNEAIAAMIAALKDVVQSLDGTDDILTDDMLHALTQAREALAQADNLKPTWTTNEVAGLKRVSVSTVTYWCRNKWLDAERDSTGRWKIRATRDELLEFRPPKSGPKAEKEAKDV